MHQLYLLKALSLAKSMKGLCYPNPSVGAIAVKNNEIIAQAVHNGAGTPHAETQLLNHLPNNCNDITLYITLEPCNHWGKTPPCVNAIIEKCVKRIVYAYKDPNPIVHANNTPKLLQDAGVEVIHYPLIDVDVFYKSYKYWMTTKKPYIIAKLAQSIDGKIAKDNGKPILLTNVECQSFTHSQRKTCDCLLTSYKTINNDNPQFNARVNEEQIKKPLAIIDPSLQTNVQAKIWSSTSQIILFHNKNINNHFNASNVSSFGIDTYDNGKLKLDSIIQILGEIGFHDIWIEVGGILFSEFHRLQLIDETYIYISPHILGQNAKPGYLYDLKYKSQISWHIAKDNIIANFKWEK
jgi:diaminohydroxyphosphoribosylaminopyrimidine deaminase / 5-amino-6-(5-phosphoribosylamino)uracil reductase